MYTTVDEIKNYLLLDWAVDFDDQVESWIRQMMQSIDNITGRTFEMVDEERKFDGNGRQKLLVDDYIDLYSVEDDDGEITVIEYPANKTPKFLLYAEAGFPKGHQNIVINADWGYSDTAPEDIKFVCTVFVAGIIQNQNRSNEIQREKIGNYEVSYMTDKQVDDFKRANDILASYRKCSDSI